MGKVSAKVQRASKDKCRFGGNREAVIQRDGEKCVRCEMTRDEHRSKYNKDLNVDHIDGQGLSLPRNKKNNSMDNLQTLCLSCHSKKDSSLRPRISSQMKKAINIRHCKGVGSSQEIAKYFEVWPQTVNSIWSGRSWGWLFGKTVPNYKVLQVENGKVVAKYINQRIAAKINRISQGDINLALHGRRNHVGGYEWLYERSLQEIQEAVNKEGK